MTALWAIIAILYVNGTPADAIISPAESEPACKAGVVKFLAGIAPKASDDMQIVAKCVDIGNLPVTGSVFGQAKKL